MKKIAFVLFILLPTLTFSQNGFNGYEWDTKKDVIESKEGKPPFSHPFGNPKWYTDTLLEKEVLVMYYYDKDLLKSGTYLLISYAPIETKEFFLKIENALAQKYGYADENHIGINEAELFNVMVNKQSYSILFKGGIELKTTYTDLYHNRKTYAVYIDYSKPMDISMSKSDMDKL